MAVTIALCIGTSAWIFGQAEPYVADFTGFDEEPEPTEVIEAAQAEDENDPPEAAEPNENTDEPEEADEAEEPADQPTLAPAPTPTASTFEATHLSNPEFTVNLRPGPSIGSGDPVDVVDPNSPLQALGDQGQDEDGLIWLLVQTEEGIEGWIREVDTVEIV